MAAATTVPTSMGMLTVPKLGPPAQDLVGAVLPAAARHAGGRVIDFKPARREERWLQELPAFLAGPRTFHRHTLSPLDVRRREGAEPEGTPRPSPIPQPPGPRDRKLGVRMKGARTREKALGPQVPTRAQLLTAVLL